MITTQQQQELFRILINDRLLWNRKERIFGFDGTKFCRLAEQFFVYQELCYTQL